MPSGNVRIWWDVSVGAFRMAAPYNAKFLELLKSLVPGSDRSWDDQTKIWTFTERFYGAIKNLLDQVYGATNISVVTRQQAEAAAAAQSAGARAISSNPIDTTILQFFKMLPYDAARKAYIVAAAQLHPDKGGSLDSMSTFNAAWQKLEREFFKKD